MEIKHGEVWAIIPARGGSKGVPRKNIKKMGGYPLIAYSIAVCKMSRIISRIVVSTDDEEIATIAKEYGAEVPFIRPKEAAGDNSTDYEFMDHAITWFADNEGFVPEFFAHIRATTPIRDSKIVDDAIEKFMNAPMFTSLRSAHKASESPYKWFLKNENGTFGSAMDELDNETINNSRSSFQDFYIPDGYVDVLRTEYIIKNKKLHGGMMMAYESPPCTEVDTIEEFDYLEYQLKNKECILTEYMNLNFKKGN